MRRRLLVGAALLLLPFALTASVVLALANDRLPVASVAESLPQDTIAFLRLPHPGPRPAQTLQPQAWKAPRGPHRGLRRVSAPATPGPDRPRKAPPPPPTPEPRS